MDLRQQLQQTLGSTYALDRELGGGGMSRVFVADERRLNRKVVIKVLSPELSEGISGERFEREIQLAASLQQANIVPILAAGETNGLPFYTMPFVEGESLRARLAHGALPVGTVVSVLRDVSKALAYAHERGVVHRDIKPDNVLLSGGTAVVTDFGIAKAISAARTDKDSGTLTQLGTSIGTPAYMSPEQAAGDPTVDHRADIYSLGCMAYELLAGHTPFHGRTPARMLAAHMTESPAPIETVRPETPLALAQLVMRCLEKDPAARPASASAIAQSLDVITSGGMAAMPDALRAPVRLGRSLAFYAVAFVAVALLARAAIIVFGLPDWVFRGAIIVMLLGLPVLLFTWYVNRTVRRLAAVTPAHTPGGTPAGRGTMATLAMRASPHVSWRRTWIGGGMALGAFAAIVAAFMVLRALGIGPAGSLLAAGKLSNRERLIVTEFQASDSSLASIATEAVRTNLSQSRVISLLPPSAIGAALQRMQRPPSSRVDLSLAREIAAREGVKAIIDGAIRPLAGGYVVSIRLVSADSANELAAYQETANGPRELLDAIDKITRKLRGKIGESLREVRGNAPLEQVTTPSLEALRKYAEGARQVDLLGDPVKGAELLREAVKIDTGFAMAWRKLGVALNNTGSPRPSIDSALGKAYALRSRLTERERLAAEATYFHLGPGHDRRRAIDAYQALLQIDPDDPVATNNLGSIYSGRREFAKAESLYKRMIATGRASQQQYTNLISILYNEGKIDESERLLGDLRERFPSVLQGRIGKGAFYYQRGQLDSMRTLYQEFASSDNVIARIQGLNGLVSLDVMGGRLKPVFPRVAEIEKLGASLGQKIYPVNDSIQLAGVDLAYYGDTARAIRRVESALAHTNLAAMPATSRPYRSLAVLFARSGQPSRARSFLAQDDAAIPDSSTRRTMESGRHAVMGYILMAEAKPRDALREFWQSDTTYDGPNGSCTICVLDDVGAAWRAMGVPDSAIYYWQKYLDTPLFGREGMDASTVAILHRRLGELYEEKHDIPNAVAHYRKFVSLWEHADPELQPQVAEVKRRLTRMADTERQ
ncbi:MAG TPA: protein kinase [Gemmatimonadaceae bacterium]|nr:protein kinase [Gemmatimonadaceae bacterium]